MIQAANLNLLSDLETDNIYSNHQTQKEEKVRMPNLPMHLLAAYPMQWALDCRLTVINKQEHFYVNAYKIASHSQLFKALIRQSSSEDPRMDKYPKCLDEGQDQTMTEEEHHLLVHCNGDTCLSDLILALHYCHLEKCHIAGDFRIKLGNTPVVEEKEYDDDSLGSIDGQVVIYRTDECLIFPSLSYCSLRCALRTASTFDIDGLRQLCHIYIKNTINTQTCWALWKIVMASSNVKQTALSIKAIDKTAAEIVIDYILGHFSQIIEEPGPPSPNYLDLTVDEIEFILCSELLNVKTEATVLQAVQRWMSVSPRCQDVELYCDVIPRILSNCVRIGQLRLTDIELVYSLPGVKQVLRKTERIKRTKSELLDTGARLRQDNRNRGWAKLHTRTTSSGITCLAAFQQARRRLYRTSRNLRPLEPVLGTSGHSLCLTTNNTTNCGSSSNAVPTTATETMSVMEGSRRETRVPHEAIFVFGGWSNGKPCRDVCVFDSRRRKWLIYGPQSEVLREQQSPEDSTDHSITDRIVLPHALMSFGIALVKHRYIYIAGGELTTANNTTSAVMRYDIHGESKLANNANAMPDRFGSGWKMCPPLHECRRDLVLVNVEDRMMYAIGGDSNQAVLNSVEQFSLDETDQTSGRGWSAAASMLIARGAPAAETLNGLVYVCGGYVESQMETLTNTCEVYSPAVNQWTFIQSMAQPRYYAYAVAVQGVLFALGGGGESIFHGEGRALTNAGYSSTVERYDPEADIWELMPPVSSRADFAACMFEEDLVCLGGGGETFCTDEVQRWRPWTRANLTSGNITGILPFSDNGSEQSSRPIWFTPDTDVDDECNMSGWSKYAPLPYPLWGHRCVVVKGLDNILPYLGYQRISKPNILTIRPNTINNYEVEYHRNVLYLSDDMHPESKELHRPGSTL